MLLLNGGLLREEAIFFIIIVDKAVFITATMGHSVVAIHLLVHVLHLGQVWLENLFELLGDDLIRSLDVILTLERYHRRCNAIFCHRLTTLSGLTAAQTSEHSINLLLFFSAVGARGQDDV